MYDAQNFAAEYAKELGMLTVPSQDVVYTEEQGYVTADVVRGGGGREAGQDGGVRGTGRGRRGKRQAGRGGMPWGRGPA